MFWLLGTVVGAYAVLAILVYLMQDRMVFSGAGRGRGQPLPAVQGVSVETLAVEDPPLRVRLAVGEPSEPPRGVLLFFVGNGEDLRSGVGWAGDLTGYGVLTMVPEYPGYGDSDGPPSHRAFMATAERAAAEAARRATALRVPLFVGGSSLGTFSAVHVASRGVAERLLLLAPPTSVAEVGAQRFPFLPVRTLVRQPFDNLEPAASVRCPSLVLHGDRDVVVPAEMGERVAAALGGEFILATGHGHTRDPLAPRGLWGARVRAFLLQ
ncbi:MAG: hypothetical protein AAF628_14215 [Planctomycetota bacterium]